ncbi:hypothetical protein OUZ56_011916 [Daphnia magna]|uniref:Uncharacterized protein n=1 Tax=Daphnia magna TaxID=35525 RepID=A0ABQ9Z1L2_9CRUS|nr:hypothetical protein OUZ56_011916 [Daphnia magna]
MVDSDRKNVIVVLESKGDEDSDDNFEICFSNENGKYSDLALIKKKLIAKSERVQNSLKDRDLIFKRQSDIKEGVWVVVSEDSPVKSGSIIKCTFKTSAKRSLHAATTDAAVMDPSSMPLVSNDEFIKELVVENVSTPVTIYDHSSQNVSTYDISHDNFFVLPQELIALKLQLKSTYYEVGSRIRMNGKIYGQTLSISKTSNLQFELIMKKSCEIFRQKWTESA